MAYRRSRRGGYRKYYHKRRRAKRKNGKDNNYSAGSGGSGSGLLGLIGDANRLFNDLMQTQDMIERRWQNRNRKDRAYLENNSRSSAEMSSKQSKAGKWFTKNGKRQRYRYASDGSRLGVEYDDGGRYGL